MVNFDYLYNYNNDLKERFTKNLFVDKKLGFSVIENGMILPWKSLIRTEKNRWGGGGIVDGKGESIPHSFAVIGHGESYTPPPESIQYSSETVVYLGMLHYVWGHVITDDISHVWFLNSDEFKREFKDCPIVCVIRSSKRDIFPTHYLRILEILGIDIDRIRVITQPTKFDKIILPDKSFGAGIVSNEYRETIDVLRNFALKNRTPIPNNKLYFFHGKRQVGEERVAEYFKSKGYDIVSPEKMTFDEQLNLFINCESFAAPIGSVAHNSVFLRDETETIFIPRSAYGFTAYQHLINQVNNVNANFVDSTLSVLNNDNDAHCYIISEQLKRFFGDKFDGYTEGDFKAFLDYYVKYYVEKVSKLNPKQVKRYGVVFRNFIEQLKHRKDLIAAYELPPDWYTFKMPRLIYQANVAATGWGNGWKRENYPSNPLGKKLYVQAIKIDSHDYKVYYSVYHSEKEGWSEEVSNGEQAGITGKSKLIYGMRVRLDEAGAKEFDILYRMHKFDDTWTPWAKNGEALYSHGQKLNAIQIKLEPVKAQPDKVDITESEYAQKFLAEIDDTIYLQVQRQDLIQIKWEAKMDTQSDKKI